MDKLKEYWLTAVKLATSFAFFLILLIGYIDNESKC